MAFSRTADRTTASPASTPVPAPRHSLSIAPDSASYKWWVTATVMLSAFLVVVSGSAMNVALPPIMTTFGLNLDQAQWILTAYMIAGAVFIPTVGWLGNRLGNRNLFLLGLLTFVGSSMLCGLAWSGPTLIFFRVLQGMGSGPITPMAMVFLNEAFPPKQRGLAMGLYGMAAAFGPAVGPVIGGYVTEYLSWRMVFYMNLLPGLLCMGLVCLVIPNTREAVKRSLDLAGLLTLAVFLVSLLIALTQGQREGWDTPYIQRLLLVAGGSFVVLLGLELTRKEPLIDLRLYKNLAFTAVSLAILLNAMNFWGTNFLQTILLQRLMDYTPAQAGYAVLPGAVGMALTTPWAGRLADKIDRRYVVLGGLTMFALASYWFSFITLDRSMDWVIWMIVGRYITIGFIFTPMNAASMMLLPPDKVRMGAGLINIMQQGIGGTVGLAMTTTMLERYTAYHASMLAQQHVSSPIEWGEILAPVRTLIQQAGDVGELLDLKALALLQQHLMQEATIAAYQDCFMMMTVLCVVVMPLVLFLRRQPAE
jgi:MFS transporter, DHA2 family, multidrug resistance protein